MSAASAGPWAPVAAPAVLPQDDTAGTLVGRAWLPGTGDRVEWQGWVFEVVDLDGKRVDKVLVSHTEQPGENE